MKSLLKLIAFPALIALLILACSKEGNQSTAPKSTLTVSKSSVNRGEPMSVTAAQVAGTRSVKWSVSPSGGTSLFPNKNSVVALFSNPGTYHVTALYYADSAGSGPAIDSSSTSPVQVSDTVFTPPPPTGYDTVPLTDVNLSVQPLAAHDTGGLYLVVSTNTWYSCYPHLDWSINPYGGVFDIYFYSVATQTNNCAGSYSMPGTAYIYLYPPPNGAYPLNIHMNGATYPGTLTVTDQSYQISWPDASRVSWTTTNVSKN